MKKTLLMAFGISMLFACKKSSPVSEIPQVPVRLSAKDSTTISFKEKFSGALARAVAAEPALRKFIKEEALKQFDNDFDVFFLKVADANINGAETFSKILLKHGLSENDLTQILDHMPTLTILVPTVPNFSPQRWETETEIPVIAVSPTTRRYASVDLMDSKGKVTKVPNGHIPGFPVLVVKENERLLVNAPSSSSARISSAKSVALSKNSRTFTFVDDAFNSAINPQNKQPIQASSSNVSDGRVMREAPISGGVNSLDPRVLEAYNKGVEWQRDYVYYGIDVSAGVTRGTVNNNYQEFITSLKMTNAILDFADQNDPTPNNIKYGGQPPHPTQDAFWTDGAFDIRINIMMNSKNGESQVLGKAFSAYGHQLFWMNYAKVNGSQYYTLQSIEPREFNVNEAIDRWDLDAYGSTWKFTVHEFDLSQETTYTISNTTKFGSNFEINASTGEKTKIGAKFGSSLEVTNSSQKVVKTTLDSDFLGEGILNFSDPIVLRQVAVPTGSPRNPYRYYWDTWDVNAGKIRITVEPKHM